MKRNITTLCAILCVVMISACGSGFFGSMDTLREKAEGGGEYDPGDGTADNPFKVGNLAALQKVGSEIDGWTLDSHYIVTADITITGTWTPIGGEGMVFNDDEVFSSGDTTFRGVFDGNGKTISLGSLGTDSCVMVDMMYLVSSYGLFGVIGDGAEVKNLKLIGSINTDPDEDFAVAGALAGINWGGSISNISSRVIVTCNAADMAFAGGIVGLMTEGAIFNCYSTANVKNEASYGDAGGIVGRINDSGISNASNIKNCWAAGNINQNVGSAGGIIGNKDMETAIISFCVALNSNIRSPDNYGRIAGSSKGVGGLIGNYAYSGMCYDHDIHFPPGSTTDKNGQDVSIDDIQASNGSWWTGTAGWAYVWSGANENTPWKWDSTNSRPILWFEAKL